MPNMNDPADLTFYYTAPLFLPATLDDTQFLGVYSSTSALPTGQLAFSTAGIAGTGAMYVYLNNAWQYIGQYLYDAYRYLVYYQGSAFATASSTKWTSIFNDIAANSNLMTEFANNNTAITNLAGSSTAMQAVGNSTTAMSAILPSSTYKETWWGSSYYVGLGLNTYTGLANSTLAGLATVSAIAGNSTAMTAIAGSSTAMNAIIASYTAMNAMTTLTAKNALQSASAALASIQTLVSNINSGSIALGGGATGSSTALGSNALLVLLSYDNGAAVPPGGATSSPTPTLASKMYTAYAPAQHSATNATGLAVTLATNQIVFAIGCYTSTGGAANGLGTGSTYATGCTATSATSILYTASNTIAYPNCTYNSPLLLSGSLYVDVESGYTTYYYYLTYTP